MLPNLPIALETVPGYTAIGWQVLTLRKGTPEAIVRKIGDDLGKVLADPQLQKRLLDTGPEFEPLPPSELVQFIRAQQKYWYPIAKKYAT